MAQGTTDTWAASRDQIIADALSKLSVVGPGEEATGVVRAHAARRLDGIVKELDAEGEFLWRVVRLTATSVASQASYALSALAFAVDAPIRYLRSGETTGTPVEPMAHAEYMVLPDRTVTSATPSRYAIEKTLSGGREALTLYLYPVPSGSGDTIEYTAALRAKDFNTGATNPDFPSSWTNALTWALAGDLAPDYGQASLAPLFNKRFETAKERLIGADNEKQGLVLVPFGGPGNW